MKNFEYKTVAFKWPGKPEKLNEEISKNSINGWELVNIIVSHMMSSWPNEVYCVYKREKN